MPSSALFLLIAALLPLAGSLLLFAIGKRLGTPLAGWVGTAFTIGSFASTLLAMVIWMEDKHGQDAGEMGVRPILFTFPWLPADNAIPQIHPRSLDLGFYVDSLTIAIFATVTLVAAIIHVFSIGFMRHVEHFPRFFAFLGLACFAMLGLAIGGTLLHLLIFWQILSLSSALLAGFPFDKPHTSNAALRTFILHLIGDCGFLIGVGILFCKLGNVTLPFLWTTLGNAAHGSPVALPDGSTFSTTLLTLTGISLFFGAVVKSAQFPLHLWMADAAAAPVPAGALICTATTTIAGVYLVARLFPILTPDARLFIAIIGLVTLTMAALIAMAQDDLPRMLVWTAVSQFGYVMLAIGVGSWIGGLFHLMTAAFSLALLFLAAGSVIAAANREQRLSQLGGLWRKLPVTAGAFAVAVLAIAGVHLLSGHFSQSIIATDSAAFASYATHMGRAWGYWIFFALPAGVICLTAFYLTRCWILIFIGQPRSADFYEQAREAPMLWGPLLALAVPTLIAGYAMNVPQLLHASIVETRKFCNDLLAQNPLEKGRKFTAFDTAWPLLRPTPESEISESPDAPAAPLSSDARAANEAHWRGYYLGARVWISWAWVLAIALAAAVYGKGHATVDRLVRRVPLSWARAWLCEGMYFDELYYWTMARLVEGLAVTAYAFDRYLLGTLVDGIARLVNPIVNRVRQHVLKK